MNVRSELVLNPEEIEKILSEYIEKNTKFTPVKFNYNMSGDYFNTNFRNITIELELK